jgi:magnesium chelatase family protein
MNRASLTSDGEPSAQIRQRVQQARRMQDQRFAKTKHVFCNAHMTTKQISTICTLNYETQSLIHHKAQERMFSPNPW